MKQQTRRVASNRMAAVLGVAALAGLVSALTTSCSGEADQAQAPEAVSVRADELRMSTTPKVTPQQSGTTNGLIGISPVNARVVWASGRNGTFLRTTDGGATWHVGVVPGADELQFRDVQGVSADVAYLLSIGVGTDSRIYKTVDGGESWTMQFQNQDPNGFYDCFAFWGPGQGITMADSVNGRFPVVRTLDQHTWKDIGDRLPPALPGEAGFASSGTCAATQGRKRAWLTTGGAGVTRVLATRNRGNTWAAYTAPITAGVDQAGGGFSIAFRDRDHGILGGGDLATTDVVDNFARSHDGGKTWQLGTSAPIGGAIYGVAYALERDRDGDDDDDDDDERDDGRADHGRKDGHGVRVVATAPSATAWSSNEGNTWNTIDGVAGIWAVAFANERTGWLVGSDGQILKIEF